MTQLDITIEASEHDKIIAPGQWRLAEVQVANWGTFDQQIYRVPISRKGHLVTGASGSGKSSLLDAIATVITPDKWLRFNQAAQGSSGKTDQRSIVSYIRGAWSRTADDELDRVVSAFLRPATTWSGIVLRYDNGTGETVTLARLFFLRGSSVSKSDLADACIIERGPLDLSELERHVPRGIDVRGVKSQWPDALVTSNWSHKTFYARMRKLLGIRDENALQLLHKTQSAKSLSSLDQLFRDHMLEMPGTFAQADNAVEQFGELKDTHQHVVDLRRQRDHLAKLAEHTGTYDDAIAIAAERAELAESVIPYQKGEALRLAEAETRALEARTSTLADALTEADSRHRASDESLSIAQQRVDRSGGGSAAELRRHVDAARLGIASSEQRVAQFTAQLKMAGIDDLPQSAGEFAELTSSITQELESLHTTPPSLHAAHAAHAEAKAEGERIDRELAAVRASATAVPARLINIRDRIAQELSIPLRTLPFAAELIQVRREYASWTGAIERVLRPFALTLLVRDEHLREVRGWVDEHHLGQRLVYEAVSSSVESPRASSNDRSLVNRVEVRSGTFQAWVARELSTRYDYTCVETTDEFDRYTRAVSINGQIKTSKTRYVKDDSSALNQRQNWVLGDSETKLEALLEAKKLADRELAQAAQKLDSLLTEARAHDERRGAMRAVVLQSWNDLDVGAARLRATELAAQLDELTRENADLQVALRAVETARTQRDLTDAARREARAAVDLAERELRDVRGAASELRAELASGKLVTPSEELRASLETRFRAVQRKISRSNIAEVGTTVMVRLNQERSAAERGARESANSIVQSATSFKERWPAAAADLGANIDDRGGYLSLHDSIVAHGLPDHEHNFLRLLRERSRELIGFLLDEIRGAPRQVEERIREVNVSLRASAFDAGTHLQIKVKTRRSETVLRFLDDLRAVAGGKWIDDSLTAAEARFSVLAELMRKFASSEHADRVWRTECLDTRRHVTFLAEERNAEDVTIATYDSGGAMSGGQQQKLVFFCLAAALRYQLARSGNDLPTYGTVVLDEAFDKADTTYTRIAMDVFLEFGFHMVLATPHKLLQTIERYITGITSVANPTRRQSELTELEWTEEP